MKSFSGHPVRCFEPPSSEVMHKTVLRAARAALVPEILSDATISRFNLMISNILFIFLKDAHQQTRSSLSYNREERYFDVTSDIKRHRKDGVTTKAALLFIYLMFQ